MINIVIVTMVYTSFGHSQISTVISSHLSKNLGHEVTIDIEDMSLTPSHLAATFLVNGALKTEVKGFWSPLDGRYDVSYHVTGKSIVFDEINVEDDIDISGTFDGTMDEYIADGKGTALEGKVDFSLHHDSEYERDVKVKLEEVSTEKSFLLAGKKGLFAGKYSLNVDVPLFSEYERRGDIGIEIHHGGVYLRRIKEQFGIQLPNDFMLQGTGHIHLSDGQHTFDAKMQSKVLDFTVKEGTFTEANKKIRGLYNLDVHDLSKIQIVNIKGFAGVFSAEGEFEHIDALRFDGKSHSLEGEINYYFDKGKLNAKIQEASLAKLFYTMHYPVLMIGVIEGKIDYDMSDKIALININTKNARFQNSSAIQKIYTASGIDFSKEVFSNTFFASSIEEGIVSFDFKAESNTGYVTLFNTKMDSINNSISSDFDLKLQGEELSGEIHGSLKSPKVKLNIGKYLEFKAKKELDAFFGMGTSDKVKDKLKDVDTEKVKGFFKGFF